MSVEAGKAVEWLALRESLRFAKRHRRYLGIFAILYGRSLLHWREMRAARVGYAYLQLFDDYMDGDRPYAGSLDELAAATEAEWKHGTFAGETVLSRLGAVFWKDLEGHAEGRRDVTALLQAMHFDSQRRLQGLLLEESILHAHLHRTFHHSVDILLVVSGLRTRAQEVPDLVKALAWCSVVRDFDEDVAVGLINLPEPVVRAARSRGVQLRTATPEVAEWLTAEKEKARECLARSEGALSDLAKREPKAAKLLGVFHRSVEKYATR